MKKTNPFKGLGIALVTPFNEDGSINFDQITELVEGQIAAGIDFLCVLGTTAETPTLSNEEKQQVMDHVVKVNNGRLPLLLGAGGNCTACVVNYLQTADLSAFQGVLIVAPYYNKPSQEGLYQHYAAIAKASPVPVVLYNVPGRTGVNIDASTTLRLARDFDNIVAIKEASGRIAQIEDIITAAPEGFDVISGDDGITYELLGLGAVGVISVVGNAYPKEFSQMVHSALQGDTTQALKIQRSLHDAYKLFFADGNPAGVKAVLSIQGKISNVLRLPLVPASAATHAKLEAFNKGFSK